MPKFPTFPTLFDDALQIKASNLNKWNYLKPDQIMSGTITWTWRKSGRQNSISIVVNTKSPRPFVELDYKYGGDPRHYKVYLETVPSNLGKGEIWYFHCPQTHKRCRKLYSVNGYFLHREAFKGAMYEKQTHSKKWREIEKVYGAYFDSEKLFSELHSKHFRKYYKGKPTKRYKKLLEQIRQCEKIDYRDVERLMIFGK
tara:strand:- start:1528 stop:2124 length:597 start_codon:yes stop_codon:yes gene_type:complete